MKPRKPQTIDDYLAALSADRRAALEKLRKAIKAAAPRAEECISYQMPAFRLDGRMLVWFGAATNHCAFYPGAFPIKALEDELAQYATSKGTIRFQPDDPLPATLVRKLVKSRIAENAGRKAVRVSRLAVLLLACAVAPIAAQEQRPNILGKLTVPAQTISVFGQRIVYYEAGHGRTVLLLANLGWDSHAWSQNLPQLARDHRVIAVDLIGTGAPAKPHLDYKMDTFTDFIAEIERHLSDHRAPYSPQELSSIPVPALFVWCREDEVTPLKWGEDFAAAVPGAQLAVINGCGHLPNIEKPAEFNSAVTRFLNTPRAADR